MQYLQLGLPVALILWFAIAPLKGRVRWAHMAMTGAMIALIVLRFQWLWPSAYAPVGLIILFLLAVFLGRRRPANHRQTSLWPGLLASFVALIASAGAAVLINARLQPATAFEAASPLETRAVVTEGGSSTLINTHLSVLDPDTPSLSGWRGSAYAVSLQAIDKLGRPVLTVQQIAAPCDGDIVGQGEDTRLGRYLIIDCAGTWIVLSGLAAVTASGPVTTAANIGDATTLTLHAQEAGSAAHPFSGSPLWIRLNGIFPVRGGILGPQN